MKKSNVKTDPIKLEIYKNLLADVAESMGVTLGRTAYSPNIKERRDYSCAVFNHKAELAAQALHIPVHLGSMPMSVKFALESLTLEPGDVALLNDPFKGGTHLPDLTMVAPVFIPGDQAPQFFVASRAHHADIGGSAPGSMSVATELFQEGLIIPPVKLISKGHPVPGVWDMILANVRTPEERSGDLSAQLAALAVGEARLKEIAAKNGITEVKVYMAALMDYAEKFTSKAIENIPDGTYEFEDFLDDDGITADPIKIKVAINVAGESAEIDFSGSSPQVPGSVNAVAAIAHSAVYYVFRCLIKENIPTNAGCFRPLSITAPQGTVVNALPPAAVAGGNVETSQRMVDALLGALALAIPHLIPAASSGTMNNITIGGLDPRHNRPFTYYETIGGGMGAGPDGPGLSAVQTHMTNTMNTPIEALEHAYPILAEKYSIRKGSGGKGKHSGGDGLVRKIKLLANARISILSDRRKFAPYGAAGGSPGQKGKNKIIRQNLAEEINGKVNLALKKGDTISIETPGGGGWGTPE